MNSINSNSNYSKIIYDVLFGSILIGLISYATINFDTNPEYIKIAGYLWGLPLLYFYFVYIIYPKGNKALKNFTIHGFIGHILTLILMIIAYLMIIYNINIQKILLFNVIYGLLSIIIYFYLELYFKI